MVIVFELAKPGSMRELAQASSEELCHLQPCCLEVDGQEQYTTNKRYSKYNGRIVYHIITANEVQSKANLIKYIWKAHSPRCDIDLWLHFDMS